MKSAAVVFTIFLSAAVLAGASGSESTLPSWKDGERAKMEKDGWFAGAELLTDTPKSDENTTEDEASDEPESNGLEDLQPTSEELAEPAEASSEVPEEFWADYFAARPKSFLVDPQELLGATESKDRLNFLNYHAGDSSIDLYVYLFKGDQEIPGEVREEELIERCFSEGRPAAVVFYFITAPQHSVLYLSPSLTDAISTSEQRRALEGSIMQALTKNDPSSQLEGFLVQMSIRLYWMERQIGGGNEPAEPLLATAPVKPKKAPKKSKVAEAIMPWVEQAKPLALQAAVTFGFLMTLVLVVWVLRIRRRYRFPEFEVEPRLGGAHAAGVGAVISFASAAQTPASQKDQMPDYLRRC